MSAHLAINKRTDGIVLTEITRLRNGGDKVDVTPETRHVVERLTGLPYGELLAVAGEARLMNGRAAMPCRSLHW